MQATHRVAMRWHAPPPRTMSAQSAFLRWKRLGRDEHGAAAVEFALVCPVLLLFLMGVVDFGRLFVIGLAVSSAADTGAQYGAQSALTSTDTAGMRTAATNDYNSAKLGSGLTITANWQCRCPTDDSAVGSCTYATCGGVSVSPRIYVSVQARRTVSLLFRYPGLPTSVAVVRRAVLRAQ